MLIRAEAEPFQVGYTSITTLDGVHREMMTDFGILRVAGGRPYSSSVQRERAFLLLDGAVRLEWSWNGTNGAIGISRHTLLDEAPTVLHLPAGAHVTVHAADAAAELAVQGVLNPKQFPPRLWRPGEYRDERFGAGTMQDTSTRIVRTFFDAATAPESEMVLGEVVNFPGKWSSYPPHHHAQPEVYHFRFFPDQGFGFSEQGEEVFKVHSRDTVTIPPHVVHPQTAAPGYAMYYIWMIPHLPDDRFGPDSRIFAPEHEWVMDPAAPIWTEGRG